MSAPVLAHPDFNRDWIMHTDSSDRAISAVLSQKDASGVERPVAFYSRPLTTAERKWDIIERECLAVVWGCERCRPFIYGSHVTIYTDNPSTNSILRSGGEANRKISHWRLKMAEYSYSSFHKVGKENKVADGLTRVGFAAAAFLRERVPSWASRVCEPAQVCTAEAMLDEQPAAPQDVQDVRTVAGVAREQFQAAQRADPVLGRIVAFLEGDSLTEGEERLKRLADSCELGDGLLWHRQHSRQRIAELEDREREESRDVQSEPSRRRRKAPSPLAFSPHQRQLVVPYHLRERVLSLFHGECLLGHQGLERTLPVLVA